MKGNTYYLAASAILGITTSFFNFHWLSLLFVGCFFMYMFLRERLKILIISLLTFVLFVLYFGFYDSQNKSHISAKNPPNYFTGEITSIPVYTEERVSFKLKLPTHETIKVTGTLKENEPLTYGLTCRLKGQLIVPSSNRNFNEFDYRKYLYRQKIHWELKVFTPINVSEQCEQSQSSLKKYLFQIRSNGINKIAQHYPQPTSGIMQALIFGDRSYMDEETERIFQKFGLIHLLAISGLHVGIIVGCLFFLGIRFGITRENTYRILLLLLPFYMLLTGASPSVLRSCMMVMAVIIAVQFKSKMNSLDSVSLVCLTMLLVRPYYLFEVGFQLSFVVSSCLILSSGIIASYESSFKKICAVSIIAQLGSFPILIYHFYEVSLISMPLNMIFVPFFSLVILPLSFISFFLLMIYPLIGIFSGKILTGLLNVSIEGLKVIDYAGLLLNLGKPPIWLLVVYFISVIYLFISWEIKHTRKMVKAILILKGLIVLHYFLPNFSPFGEVTMLDVGQGDSIFIQLPFGKGNYLIDSGGTFNSEWDPGEDVVIPYLKSKGIRTLDKIILTHGDYDHIGGMKEILKQWKVKSIVIGKGPVETEVEREIYEIALQKGVQIEIVKRGDVWRAGTYSFFVLSPTDEIIQDRNNRSVVIFTELGGEGWLFAGDLEEEGEKSIQMKYPKFQSDVLKVGHHGSNSSTSTEFLEYVKPRVAFISVGAKNRYGHPHPDVIERLNNKGIKIYRTDTMGAVKFIFLKQNGTFYHVLP